MLYYWRVCTPNFTDFKQLRSVSSNFADSFYEVKKAWKNSCFLFRRTLRVFHFFLFSILLVFIFTCFYFFLFSFLLVFISSRFHFFLFSFVKMVDCICLLHCLCCYHECYEFERAFFTLRRFLPSCWFQGFPGSRQFNLKVSSAPYWSSKHSPNPAIRLNSYLNICLKALWFIRSATEPCGLRQTSSSLEQALVFVFQEVLSEIFISTHDFAVILLWW